MGMVTVVCSGKGGVGKSTTTVGLGYALSEKGNRVLMIDCDAGLRSLDRLTGIDESLVYDASDVVRGICAPINAIYHVGWQDSLFVMPAPASAENMVSAKAMVKLVEILKKYYDHILIDCPAGVGRGFKAAVSGAENAIVVCNPDPVCVRSSSIVRDILTDMGKTNIRLVINRFNNEFFKEIQIMEDLDRVIDETGIRLVGVVPEDYSMAAAFLKGKKADENSKAVLALQRISARLEGIDGPIIL